MKSSDFDIFVNGAVTAQTIQASEIATANIIPARNQTVLDPYLTDLGKVTLDKLYIPTNDILNTLSNQVIHSHPTVKLNRPDYLEATIQLYYDNTESVGDKFELLFLQSFSESLSANYIKESPVGSAYPIIAFANAGATQIPLSFMVTSDYLPSNETNLHSYITRLKKMVRPKYSEDVVRAPSVAVTVADVSFYGVCDSISVEYGTSYGANTFNYATINCQFTVSRYING